MLGFEKILNERVKHRTSRSWLDINTKLENFAIISYKVPIERVIDLIPNDFKLWTFFIDKKEYALISAVPFIDKDFVFKNITRKIKFKFAQTNFRTYIINKATGEHCAWFFASHLNSIAAYIPKYIWRMPWHKSKFKFQFIKEHGLTRSYKFDIISKTNNCQIDIEELPVKMQLLEGFKSMAEQELILTHPVKGYFNLNYKTVGTYEIWHPKMILNEGMAHILYFEIFERLGLLSENEMQTPHSILMMQNIEFDVLLPPKKKSTASSSKYS